jgi:hypothetical protein
MLNLYGTARNPAFSTAFLLPGFGIADAFLNSGDKTIACYRGGGGPAKGKVWLPGLVWRQSPLQGLCIMLMKEDRWGLKEQVIFYR